MNNMWSRGHAAKKQLYETAHYPGSGTVEFCIRGSGSYSSGNAETCRNVAGVSRRHELI